MAFLGAVGQFFDDLFNDDGDGSSGSTSAGAAAGATSAPTTAVAPSGEVSLVAPPTGPGSGGTNGDDVLIGGGGNDNLAGGPGNDILYGGGGADRLDGGDGADYIDGGPGVDRLIGGAGNDTLVADGTGDIVDGGLGIDTLVYADRTGGVDITLGDANDRGVEAVWPVPGSDTVIGVENFVATPFDDRVFGNGSANLIYGGGGNDLLRGLGGNDSLLGGSGNDVLEGGAGRDVLSGGTGADTFRFQQSTGDVVTDYSKAEGDVIQLGEPASSYRIVDTGNDVVVMSGEVEVVRIENVTDPSQVTFDYAGLVAA